MPQRSLASLVLGPVFFGALCLVLACVAGERTDRMSDTATIADTLHQLDAPHGAADSTASADADSAAASQLAVAVDSSALRDTATRQQGTTSAPSGSPRMHRHNQRSLSALAETIANGLVFVPVDRAWFTAASRGKRMLLDIGRVDVQVGADTASRRAYEEAVERLSPVPVGTRLRLRGPFGSEEARVRSFGRWNGRIVARLEVSKQLDSMARVEDMLPATAVRIDTTTAAAPDSSGRRADSVRTAATTSSPACARDTLPTDLATRGLAVRDSIARFLVDSVQPPYERLLAQAKVYSASIPGCFGIARLLIVVNRRTPDMEFAVERAALVDSSGKVQPLRFQDLRFKAHDPLYVFDADGDGLDDLAARGYAERSGGLSIMRLDLVARRFARLASGFAWEQ